MIGDKERRRKEQLTSTVTISSCFSISSLEDGGFGDPLSVRPWGDMPETTAGPPGEREGP
jgi:hypothetical protein